MGKTRKEFLIETIDNRIKETNVIISSASDKCSQLKILFISFCLPTTATIITMYIANRGNEHFNSKLTASIVIFFYLLLSISAFAAHYSFYKRQFRYRKVKDSLDCLKEKLIIMSQDISDDITSETFAVYYRVISNVSKYTFKKRTILWKAFVDCLFYVIPIIAIIAVWSILFFR